MILLALALLAAPPQSPPADPWSLSVSEEGSLRDWLDDPKTAGDQSFHDGMNRLYAVLAKGSVELGLQLDLALSDRNSSQTLTGTFTPKPPAWPELVVASTRAVRGTAYGVVVEKKFLHWKGEHADVRVGDSYRSVGRGMVLALIRNSPLDIDTSIDGAQAQLSTDAVDVAGWAGEANPQTISVQFPNRIGRDVRDHVGGGQLTAHAPFGDVSVFGNAIEADPHAPSVVLLQGDTFSVHHTAAGGASFSASNLGGTTDVYLEADTARIEGLGSTSSRTLSGEGYYASLTSYLPAFTLQIEGKRYYRMELLSFRESGTVPHVYDYSTPPTLEKEDIIDFHTTEAANSNDILGGRAIASRSFGSELVHLTYAHFEDHGEILNLGVTKNENARIQHVYGTVERRSAGHYWQATAGCRYETHLANPSEHDVQVHADADVLFPVGGWSVEGKWLVYRQVEWLPSPLADTKQTSDVTSGIVSVRPNGWLSLALSIDTTDDPRSISGIGVRQGNLSKDAFGGVELAMQPSESSNVRLFAGATQGGLKCSGGTCGYVPAFSGVRLSWLARF